MTKSNDFGLLYKFNYPPYQIVGYSNNSFLVCGGGGAAKTGVPNKIELFEISEINGVDHLSVPNIKINSSFDSGAKAIMSLRRHFNYILSGEGGDLCEYILCGRNDGDVGEEEAVEGNDDEEAIVRDRKNKHDERRNDKNEEEFDMKLHRKLSPCFPSPNQLVNKNIEVNVVRYGDQGGNSVVAGGSNGIVRVYQRYSDDRPMDLVLQREFNDVSSGGHAVVDLDVSPSLDEMVTVCDNPDGKYARVWSISRGVKITELALTSSPRGGSVRIDSIAYRFKHCRYAVASLPNAAGLVGGRRAFLLYATHQPVVNDKSKSSFVSVWGPLDAAVGTDYQLVDVVDLGTNLSRFGTRPTKMRPTALSTAHCGSMVAIGSGEGAVAVYRLTDQTHKLTRIYNLPKAHSFFVTDITFLPSSRALNTGHQFELLSIGVDSMLRYHRAPHKPSYLRLERLYKLLFVFLLIFFCDRILLLLSLF